MAELLSRDRGMTAYYACLTLQNLSLDPDNREALAVSAVVPRLVELARDTSAGEGGHVMCGPCLFVCLFVWRLWSGC